MSTTFRLVRASSCLTPSHCFGVDKVISEVSKWMKANQKMPGQVSFGLEVTLVNQRPVSTPWKHKDITRTFTARDHAKATYTLRLILETVNGPSSMWYDPYIRDDEETATGAGLLVTFHDAALATLFRLWIPSTMTVL